MHDGPPMHGGTAVADADGTLAPAGTVMHGGTAVADADGTLAPDGTVTRDATATRDPTAMRDDHYDAVRPLRRRTSTMHPARWSRPGTPVLQPALGPPSARSQLALAPA
ncbi:hypothetical protein [Streptomyces sp. NPDC058252]|uniref:hypothetical protein n=1 Tax=Streptomyces sp. NPDC058252 TaxID=3346405 RepID=UPI0036E7DA37